MKTKTASTMPLGTVDLTHVTTVLLDADGTLFGSEEPAYAASAGVTNALLAALGIERDYTPEELQAIGEGKNFRAAALDLALAHGVPLSPDELERWVLRERDVVTAHLRDVLAAEDGVADAVQMLGRRFGLAVVTSSAMVRLETCLGVTGLADLLPSPCRFSAEDSLESPVSKPDPAIYRHAARALDLEPDAGLAVEDTVNGVRSAVAAGFTTVGTVQFVPVAERPLRAQQLLASGAVTVIGDLRHLVPLLGMPLV